ncbi:MAG: TIGR02281 family clan AA aspartic protease [Gammaproteobacteria bacterium]|nr:TIGR02281 family clan AA aspartic protease [Gammaproteobacteria bacterium]
MTDISKRIARWMIWLGWLIFLALLTVFFNKQLSNIQNPNQNVTEESSPGNSSTVTLLRNRQGHYVANGLINGEEVVFIVDTGASDVSIPVNIAKKLNLKNGGPVRYHTANGTVTGSRTMLDTVQLGGIVLQNIRGGINPGMKDNYILLGMSFLKQLEFTQRGNELILKRYNPPNINRL